MKEKIVNPKLYRISVNEMKSYAIIHFSTRNSYKRYWWILQTGDYTNYFQKQYYWNIKRCNLQWRLIAFSQWISYKRVDSVDTWWKLLFYKRYKQIQIEMQLITIKMDETRVLECVRWSKKYLFEIRYDMPNTYR